MLPGWFALTSACRKAKYPLYPSSHEHPLMDGPCRRTVLYIDGRDNTKMHQLGAVVLKQERRHLLLGLLA